MLRVEELESRLTPAVASITGTTSVNIRADGLSPTNVKIEWTGPNSLNVYENNLLVHTRNNVSAVLYTNTSIQPDTIEVDLNGQAVTPGINLYTGNGADSITVHNGELDGRLYLLLREGDDTVTIDGKIDGHTDIVLAGGNDLVSYFGQLGSECNLTILGYAGNDSVTVDGAVGNNLYVQLGAGNDVFVKGPSFAPTNPSRYHEFIST